MRCFLPVSDVLRPRRRSEACRRSSKDLDAWLERGNCWRGGGRAGTTRYQDCGIGKSSISHATVRHASISEYLDPSAAGGSIRDSELHK